MFRFVPENETRPCFRQAGYQLRYMGIRAAGVDTTEKLANRGHVGFRLLELLLIGLRHARQAQCVELVQSSLI